MSMRFKGGVISATAPTTLSGVWTLQQQIQKLAAGDWSGLSKLYSWGGNAQGQLGLNDTINRSSPVQVGALTTWATVSAGSAAVAVKTDGTLWSWGQNAAGQLGLNDTVLRSSPVQVGALTAWFQVDNGGAHTVAIKTDGTLWSWGQNASGQLGLNDIVSRSSPVQVGALTTWFQASGYYSTLAIKTP